jgi:hypothetical protein
VSFVAALPFPVSHSRLHFFSYSQNCVRLIGTLARQ